MTNCNSCGGTTVFVSGNTVRCEYCGKIYSTMNGELSTADPEKLYNNAVSLSKSKDEEGLKSAIQTFEALGSYKDSSTLANACRGMIAKSRVEEEDRRLNAARQAELERIESEKEAFEKRQREKMKRITIAGVSAIVLIVIAVCIITNTKKSSSYNKAMEMYNEGQYEEAREAFKNLGDYSDAATYVSEINRFLTERERKYEKGINYYEKGAYSECITSLVDISNYLDSQDYIEKSVEEIYQQATEHYDAGEFEKAKELLGKIPVSSSKNVDAELLLADIEEIIIEQVNAANYEQAKGYYDNGDYETAQRLFIGLTNYRDSMTYLSSIGTDYYEQAKKLFKKKEYVQCGEILQYIDTNEEWGEYSIALELKQQASVAYVEIVKEEARNICRSAGYESMAEYIDNNIGVLLSSDEASILKKECDIEIISFANLEPYAGTYDYQIGGERTDIMGNTYVYTFRGCSGIESGHYLLYDISGRYKYFNATVAVEKQSGNIKEKYVGHIRIYGDGRLLWSDDNIRGTTKPYEINVDVENVVDLRIELYGQVPFTGSGVRVLLGNPTLSE